MKKLVFAFVFIFNSVFLQAQENTTIVNDPNAVVRKVDNFKAIDVSGSVTVYLSQGRASSLAVSSNEEKNIEMLITKVENGVLKIYVDKSKFKISRFTGGFRAYITINQLEKLDVSGACSVKFIDPISVENLKIDIAGASKIAGELNTKYFSADVSGASSIKINGSAKNADFHVSGASTIKALDFLIDNCKIKVSGASNASINVSQSLDANASGASVIKYIGKAQIENSSATGASSIKQISE